MATEYPRYQMQDGKTRLSQEYFNPIWQALDSRLDTLEKKKWEIEEAIRQLQEFALDRIDASLVPVLDEAQSALSEAQTILADLQAMITEADIPALISAAMAPFISDVEAALAAQSTETTEAINSLQEELAAVRTLAYAGL